MKEEGKASKAPLREAFGQWKNAKFAVIALSASPPGRPWSGTRASSTAVLLQNVVKVDSFTATCWWRGR